jgi:hypothetical protein
MVTTMTPFEEGADAFGRGFSRNEGRNECPHPEGSDEREDWLEEWLEGWDQKASLDDEGELKDGEN